MRCACYTTTGPAAEVLKVTSRPDPVAGSGEVLVKIRASGINPADVKRRGGWLGARMDHEAVIPHCDGAGEIIDAGPGVDRGRIGERWPIISAVSRRSRRRRSTSPRSSAPAASGRT